MPTTKTSLGFFAILAVLALGMSGMAQADAVSDAINWAQDPRNPNSPNNPVNSQTSASNATTANQSAAATASNANTLTAVLGTSGDAATNLQTAIGSASSGATVTAAGAAARNTDISQYQQNSSAVNLSVTTNSAATVAQVTALLQTPASATSASGAGQAANCFDPCDDVCTNQNNLNRKLQGIFYNSGQLTKNAAANAVDSYGMANAGACWQGIMAAFDMIDQTSSTARINVFNKIISAIIVEVGMAILNQIASLCNQVIQDIKTLEKDAMSAIANLVCIPMPAINLGLNGLIKLNTTPCPSGSLPLFGALLGPALRPSYRNFR